MKKDILKLNVSHKHMKKVREMFKEIEHITIPYSGTQLLNMVRKENGLIP